MNNLIQQRAVRTLGLAVLGFAASSAAWAQNGPFMEENGLVVIEIESGSATGSWSEETSLSGFAGSSYTRWTGPNHFSQPGNDVFGFEFQINDPGQYHFRIHNRHEHADSTEANDVWVRMDGGAWVKTFSWQRGQWTWATQHEFDHHNKPYAEYQLTAGVHRIEFSGRSHDFMMDRFHLYKNSVHNPMSTSHPESSRETQNQSPLASAAIVPAAVPENDSFQSTVTLDGRRSFDPDGDALSYHWNIRGARFLAGTQNTDRVVQVRTSGEFAIPVELTVTDGEYEDSKWSFINVEDAPAHVSGAGCVWHPVTLDFEGPMTSESATAPNPFLDYRLNVTFSHPDGTEFVVPGFYAGDGQGHGAGNIWRTRFTPDRAGVWSYSASFRGGEGVAVSLDSQAGQATHFDGGTGAIGVLPRDPGAPGLLADGRLEYVNDHYLKQRDGGFFIKTGTNSPENFMAFAGFDDVQDNGGVGIIHSYTPHRADWNVGDPLFRSSSTGVDSRGIIGALNYLGDQGVNALYFLPMNLGGDGQDTTPFIGYQRTSFDKTHYDISRLHQWNMVLNHAQEQGIMLHVVLAETELANETWLDDGYMGQERKLFFRELSARFGYVNGLKWNLSEENDYPVTTLREMASYLDAVDPYDHPTSVHTHPNDLSLYQQIVGDPLFDSASVQYLADAADNLAQTVRQMTANSGRKWTVDMDENGTWNEGLSGSNAVQMRREVLYDVLFSSGGIEWYCGYHDLPLGGDVKMENFRTREDMWRFTRIAREFMAEHLSVERMHPADHIVTGENGSFGGAEALLEPDQKLAIFLPSASQVPTVNMSELDGTYRVRWFNPRNGQLAGRGPDVSSSQGAVQLQVVITNTQSDWIVLLDRIGD